MKKACLYNETILCDSVDTDSDCFLSLEPNNDSPLNFQAAELWKNQTKYKKHLIEEYNRAVSHNQEDS